MNDLEQYNRRENLKIYDVPESFNSKDVSKDTLLEKVEVLNIKLPVDDCDIQHAHRLGKKKRSPNPKPRPMIARFISYKKQNEFMYS